MAVLAEMTPNEVLEHALKKVGADFETDATYFPRTNKRAWWLAMKFELVELLNRRDVQIRSELKGLNTDLSHKRDEISDLKDQRARLVGLAVSEGIELLADRHKLTEAELVSIKRIAGPNGSG